jgi:hypothetical protein
MKDPRHKKMSKETEKEWKRIEKIDEYQSKEDKEYFSKGEE